MLGAASGGADGPLGPPTMVRMWIDGSAPKSLVSTGPAPSRAGAGVDAYPAPCTASSERLP
jgi:hypothetical protein